MSTFVFSSSKVVLSAENAWLGVQPIAVKTCEGSGEPVEQAEPLDAQIPFAS